MNIVILDADTLGEDLDLSPLERFGTLKIYGTTSPDERSERVCGADIVITNKVVLDREIMSRCEGLKLICVAATGMNNIDLETAGELGIAVKNVAGYSTPGVVQHTFAILLELMERVSYYDGYVKSLKWSQSPIFTHLGMPFHEIASMRWGVIGMGTIGREVAKVASAFGAEVIYYPTSGKPHCDEYRAVSLDELMSGCDIVSIHAPLNGRTEGLIGGRELGMMRDGAILLNLGRGGIVDEESLASELDRREIYAGLDVTSMEPLPADSPLLSLEHPERIVVTPHVAWSSIESRRRLLDGIVKNIEESLNVG
jgi:glycerate dehydrogenase